ncbi:unnamed protein product [Gadus morhua 'NCC']
MDLLKSARSSLHDWPLTAKQTHTDSPHILADIPKPPPPPPLSSRISLGGNEHPEKQPQMMLRPATFFFFVVTTSQHPPLLGTPLPVPPGGLPYYTGSPGCH